MAGHEDGFVLLNLDLWILILGCYFMKMMDFFLVWDGGHSQNWEIIINPGVYWIHNNLFMELKRKIGKRREETPRETYESSHMEEY